MNRPRTRILLAAAAAAAAALLLAGGGRAADRALGLPLSGAAYRLAEQAYQAYERRDYRLAEARAREALRLRPDVESLRKLLDVALAAQNTRAGAPPDPAYLFAARAYVAYAAHDYAAAATHAARALARAPAKLAYRLLLVDALAAANRPQDALAALDAAPLAPDAAQALAARRDALRLRLAGEPLARMYRASEANDLAGAAQAAAEAVAAAPQVTGYRLLLVRALARAGRWDEAAQAADAALAQEEDDPALLAMRGFLHARGGQFEAAEAAFARALGRQDLEQQQRRQIALLAADAALTAGRPAQALEALAACGGEDDDAVRGRAGAARADLAALAAGRTPRPATLELPELACLTAQQGQVCDVLPGGPGRDPAFEAASDAYAALAARHFDEAVARARDAVAAAPSQRAWRLLLLAALEGAKQHAEAETLASGLLAEDGADADLLVRRARLRKELARPQQARADFSAALELHTLGPDAEAAVLIELGRRDEAAALLSAALAHGELDGKPDADIAYLAARAGNAALALDRFAHAGAALPPGALMDAAYAALRAGRDHTAIGYFRRSIEAAQAGTLVLDDSQLFAARRSVAELSRTGGLFAALSYRGAGPLRGLAGGGADAPAPPGIGRPGARAARDDSVQAGVEAYWRPFGSSNGRRIELFARAYQALQGAAGHGPLQAAAGVRAKPFGASNLTFSVARLAAGGDAAEADWLAQASYFYGHGTDQRPRETAWWTTQVSAELGHYFGQGRNYALLSGQFGRSWRPAAGQPNLLLFPHLSIEAAYDSSYAVARAAGAGPGLTLRYWFREDAYAAPRSYLDFTVQYRASLGGDARGKGLFVTSTLSW